MYFVFTSRLLFFSLDPWVRVILPCGREEALILLRHCDGYVGYMYLGLVTSHSCALMRVWLRLRSTPGSFHEWLCMFVGACVRILCIAVCVSYYCVCFL